MKLTKECAEHKLSIKCEKSEEKKKEKRVWKFKNRCCRFSAFFRSSLFAFLVCWFSSLLFFIGFQRFLMHVYQWLIIHFSWPLADLYCEAKRSIKATYQEKPVEKKEAIERNARSLVCFFSFIFLLCCWMFYMFLWELDSASTFKINLNFNTLLLLIRCVFQHSKVSRIFFMALHKS